MTVNTNRLINALINAINADDVTAMGALIDSLVALGTPSAALNVALADFDGDDTDDIEQEILNMG